MLHSNWNMCLNAIPKATIPSEIFADMLSNVLLYMKFCHWFVHCVDGAGEENKYVFVEICFTHMKKDRGTEWPLNIKMPSQQYRNSYLYDKTVWQPSKPYNGNLYL